MGCDEGACVAGANPAGVIIDSRGSYRRQNRNSIYSCTLGMVHNSLNVCIVCVVGRFQYLYICIHVQVCYTHVVCKNYMCACTVSIYYQSIVGE